MFKEQYVGEYQCGFKKNRLITDQIFVLQTLEKFYEHNDLINLFLDFMNNLVIKVELYKELT